MLCICTFDDFSQFFVDYLDHLKHVYPGSCGIIGSVQENLPNILPLSMPFTKMFDICLCNVISIQLGILVFLHLETGI